MLIIIPMDIRSLRYFVAVAEEGSFRRAAERVGVSQPAVSQALAQLEAEEHRHQRDRDSLANEQRLLRHPAIIEALYLNKHVRMSTVDRAVELAARNGLDLKNIAIFSEIKAAIEGELIPEASEEPAPDDFLFQENLDRIIKLMVTNSHNVITNEIHPFEIRFGILQVNIHDPDGNHIHVDFDSSEKR